LAKGHGASKAKGRLTRGLLGFLAFAVIVLAVILFFRDHASTVVVSWISKTSSLFEEREKLRVFIRGFGRFAPVVFILLQASQVVLSPVPGEVTGFIGGFIFGLPAFFYSSIGLSLGSLGAFMISRAFRGLVRPWVETSRYYTRFEALLEHQGLFVTFLLFVFPGFPKDFLCYFLGLSRMPWEIFLFLCTVGRMPGTLMLTIQGADLFEGRFMRFGCVLGVTVLILVPMYLLRERIYAWVERRIKEEKGSSI